jgi:SAM-dependent methyltransferase
MADGSAESRRERTAFDSVAPRYARYRPGYPSEVVADLVARADIHAGSRVLEIGCGSGQLSVPLAELGADLLAVELGPALAALAQRRLAPFPHARVEVASFEEFPLPADPVQAVVCAGAFHWLDPRLRVGKCAAALGPGGALAIITVHHVKGGTPGFFQDTQPYYRKWGLSDDPFFAPPDVASAPLSYTELDQSDDFRAVERHRFERPQRFTTESYAGWLSTDSLILTLDRRSQEGFLTDIALLIEKSYGGAVERNFLYEVVVARRAAPAARGGR